jgi:ABC-type branched-subunit amino acid transport system substrate-binding protein
VLNSSPSVTSGNRLAIVVIAELPDQVVAPVVNHGVRVGAFAPLTYPGFVPAGRHLRAGLELGVDDVNRAGGIAGKFLELILHDTAGNPDRATSALHELNADGVVAAVGEFHSIVARRLAELTHSHIKLPFVCSSATLDNLTSATTDYVARLAPPQSHGWRVYADFLLDAGHKHVALALHPDEYWSSGAAVLEAHLRQGGGLCTRIDVTNLSDHAVVDRLVEMNARTLLLLVGYPEPLAGIVKAVRSDNRFDHLFVGDPAGRAEFPEWWELVGRDGLGVPYLRYVPTVMNEFGASVESRLAKRLGEPPSFVALEGYDTILVLSEGLRLAGDDRERLGRALRRVQVLGTRGLLQFSRTPGVGVLQWVWPPVQVAAHTDASHPGHVTVLRQEHVGAIDH